MRRLASIGASRIPVLAGIEDLSPRSEIDTTPLTSVVLVLLIIFMTFSPSMTIEYFPPEARSALARPKIMPTLGIDLLGRYYVGDRPVPDRGLEWAIRAEMRSRPEADAMLIKAEPAVHFDRVEEALRGMQRAGVRRVLIDARPPRSER